MKITFAQLLENMENDKLGDKQDRQAYQVIKNGLDIREDFWDDFISIIGNANGVSELFEVPKYKILSWASKIKSIVSEIQNNNNDDSERDEVISTGN